ncbi:hypothetical protein DDE82_000333 [Stemphylium lycopersici]|nr:hypothetical protein DDE82_000333 [Stemphylium lycopersici]
MASLGGIQSQLSQIISDARVEGFKMEDVMPDETQEHFQKINDLKDAREYIKEMECREKDLQMANSSLQARLKEKEDELENQPEEYKTLKVDIQQAQRHIDYYKELAENSQRRAERYQRNLAQSTKEQVTTNEYVAKIERLEKELQCQQATIRQLQDENSCSAEIFASLRAEDAKIIAANEARLAEMLTHASQVETESETFSEVYSDLVEKLETENLSAAFLLNDKGLLLRRMEMLYNIIVSEVTPLNRFFVRAFDVLQIYQFLFQALSDPYATGVGSLPRDLDELMASATQDLHAYHELRKAFSDMGGIAEEQVRTELNGISKSADNILTSLYFIKGDVEGFLARLHREPSTWLAMKARFGGKGVTKRFLTG